MKFTDLMFRTCAVLFLVHGVCASNVEPARAQSSRDGEAQSAVWHVGGFVGLARDSPAGTFLGVTPGRDHYFVGVHALTRVLRLDPVSISYGIQLLPFVGVEGRAAPTGYGGARDADGEVPGPELAYAYGVSPFGLEVGVYPLPGVGLYGAAAAGGLVFRDPFPVPEARRTNFTLEYGGGALIHTGRGQWLRLGYKYHHLSNAYTARVNPGLDGFVFYAGYQVPVRLPR